jgi:hypothetical protein
MSTCRPNLTHSFLTVCEIITFKVEEEVFFHCVREGQQCFGGQKTIFRHRYGLPDLKFLFIVELGTCVQNLIFTKGVEGCQKIFSTKGYAEIHIQRPFFDNKNSI